MSLKNLFNDFIAKSQQFSTENIEEKFEDFLFQDQETQQQLAEYFKSNYELLCEQIWKQFSRQKIFFTILSLMSSFLIRNKDIETAINIQEFLLKKYQREKNQYLEILTLIGVACCNLVFMNFQILNYELAFKKIKKFNKKLRNLLQDRKFKEEFYQNENLIYVFILSFILLGVSIVYCTKGKSFQIYEKIIGNAKKLLQSSFQQNSDLRNNLEQNLEYLIHKVTLFMSSDKKSQIQIQSHSFFLKNDLSKILCPIQYKEKSLITVKSKLLEKDSLSIEKIENVKRTSQLYDIIDAIEENKNLLDKNNYELIQKLEDLELLESDDEIKEIIDQVYKTKQRNKQLMELQRDLLKMLKKQQITKQEENSKIVQQFKETNEKFWNQIKNNVQTDKNTEQKLTQFQKQVFRQIDVKKNQIEYILPTMSVVDKIFNRCLLDFCYRDKRQFKMTVHAKHQMQTVKFLFEGSQDDQEIQFMISMKRSKIKGQRTKTFSLNQIYILFKEIDFEQAPLLIPLSSINRFEEFFFHFIMPRLESYNKVIKNDEENLNFYCRKNPVYPKVINLKYLQMYEQDFYISGLLISHNIMKLTLQDKETNNNIETYYILQKESFSQKFGQGKQLEEIQQQIQKLAISQNDKFGFIKELFNAQHFDQLKNSSIEYGVRNFIKIFELNKFQVYKVIKLQQDKKRYLFQLLYLNRTYQFVSFWIYINQDDRQIDIFYNKEFSDYQKTTLSFQWFKEKFWLDITQIVKGDIVFFFDKICQNFITKRVQDLPIVFIQNQMNFKKGCFFLKDNYCIPVQYNFVYSENKFLMLILKLNFSGRLIKTVVLFEEQQEFMMNHLIKKTLEREVKFIIRKLCSFVMGVFYPNNMIIFDDEEITFVSLNKIYYNII